MKADPKTKEFRKVLRKALRDGALTEKELIGFIRSRRASHRQKKVEFEEIKRSIDEETGPKDAREENGGQTE